MKMQKFLRMDSRQEDTEEQLDNRFTLLQILESTKSRSACYSGGFMFILPEPCDVINCWSMESSKLNNCISLGTALKKSSMFMLYANKDILLLVTLSKQNSFLSIWDYKKASHGSFLEPCREITGKVDRCALASNSTLALHTCNLYVSLHDIHPNRSITDRHKINKSEVVSFLELSKFGFLYFGHKKELRAVNLENLEENKINTEHNILVLYEVVIKTTSVIVTCHRGHYVRIWKKNLGILGTVDLSEEGERNSEDCVYSVFYVLEYDELVIGHNDNIAVYSVTPLKLVKQKSQAHQGKIVSISFYKSRSFSYLLTMCNSAIKMWRYGKNLDLKGEIVCSSVDIFVAVPNVGLYLSGACYEVGLVLWRDANVYLSQQLKSSRKSEDLVNNDVTDLFSAY